MLLSTAIFPEPLLSYRNRVLGKAADTGPASDRLSQEVPPPTSQSGPGLPLS